MPGLIRGVARTAAVAGTATAVSNRVSRRQANRWAEQSSQGQPPPQSYEAPPPPQSQVSSGGDDMYAKLEKLGQLHDAGVLTDEEFAQQKARILSG